MSEAVTSKLVQSWPKDRQIGYKKDAFKLWLSIKHLIVNKRVNKKSVNKNVNLQHNILIY